MTFRIINTALINSVAKPLEQFCIARFGKQGFKIEEGIHPALGWAPTIQIRRNKFEIIAIEISSDIYPQILKIIAHDIKQDFADLPVTVYVGCPLDVYLADQKQKSVRQLKEHGFGLYTVDDSGIVTEQIAAIPLIHHIAENELSGKIKRLPNSIKVKFQDSFGIYRTNANQGLQESGQIIEGLIFCLAKHSSKNNWITSIQGKSAAQVIDLLYASTEKQLSNERAALGKARHFIKTFRNMASHPPKNIKDAAQRTKLCRSGFIDAMTTCEELCDTLKKLKITIKLYIP